MNDTYCQYPEIGVTADMRQVFIYATPEDSRMLPQFAKEICDPKTGTTCLVKWLAQYKEINEADLSINLLQSQVLIVFVTPTLLSDIRENGLPLAIRIIKELNRPYFPVATFQELLESYCLLDRSMHGIAKNDVDFTVKLKEALR
jgi:hypothetical protein